MTRILGAVVLAVTLLAVAQPTSGQIPEDADRYKGWTVSRLRVEGIPDDLHASLLAGLALSGEKQLLGRRKADFYGSVLEQDLARTRLFLAQNGYPDARIQAVLKPDDKNRSVVLTLIILGEPVRVASVTVEGFPDDPPHLDDASLLPRAGDIFRDARMSAASTALTQQLKRSGHFRAKVTLEINRAASRQVNVVFHAVPGPVYAFRETEVVGAPENLVALTLRTADLERGVIYSPRRVRDADENLRLLNLFGQIRIDLREAGTDSVDAVISVTELEPRVFEAGIGYWTEDALRLSARWQHRNLFLGGRGLGLSGLWSPYTARLSASTWWPALLSNRSRLELEGSVSRDSEPNYVQTDLGITLQNRWVLATRSYWILGANLSRVDVVSEPVVEGDIPAEQGFVTTASAVLEHDKLNNPALPTDGEEYRLRGELSPGFVSVSPYALGELSGIFFRTLKVFSYGSLRYKLGLARPIAGNDELLPNRRFFSGGSATHRGFHRRKLGPLDSNLDPLGGNAVFELSLDLRFPIWNLLNGAMFVDTGQVWERVEDMTPYLEVAVGPGLWVKTPVGPVRIDYGYRLTTRSPEPRAAWHLTLGTSF